MPSEIRFDDIKAHGGDQRRAFEELCFQLFAQEYRLQGEVVRREGAGGDRGLEGYLSDNSGRVLVGVQAKFFLGQFRNTWWSQIEDSAQTAITENASDKTLRRYIICTPLTLTEHQRSDWENRRLRWQSRALEVGYSTPPEFVHWDYSELLARILQPENHGQYVYWFGYPHLNPYRFADLNHTTIEALAERYVPNLHTRTQVELQLHRFLRTEHFWQEFADKVRDSLGQVLQDPWYKKEDWNVRLRPLVADAKRSVEGLVRVLGDGCRLPASLRPVAEAASISNQSVTSLRKAYDELMRVERGSSEKVLQDEFDRDFSASLHGLTRWFREIAFLPDNQCLVLSGEAGSGKTHTLARVCTEFEQAGGAVLLMEGRHFISQEDPWSQILHFVGFEGTVRDFLACFSVMASSTPLVGLICIDALNETPHREIWLNRLLHFAAELHEFTNLKLIISCRTDFIDLTIPREIADGVRDQWSCIEHHGLGVDVFHALPKYLAAYKVRGVGVLPLAHEFENPLLLKIFCEAFENERVPTGTLTLPRIFGKYVERKSANIEQRIGCAASVVTDALRVLARKIADANLRPLPEREVRQQLDGYHQGTNEAHRLYPALRSEGIIHELPGQDDFGPIYTVRFAYERVWDYILSTYLLPKNATPSAELRELLATSDWRRRYPNVLRMLAIRLPEEGLGELHDFIGVRTRNDLYLDQAFLASIVWRTNHSFTERTAGLWEELHFDDTIGNSLLYLLSLASLEAHPWNANYLHDRLMAMPLNERDREWTRALNDQFVGQGTESVAIRLIQLVESEANIDIPDAQKLLLATALAWLLSTTRVEHRTRTALALAKLLRNHPRLTVTLVERFQNVNDPYVFERILYAAAVCATYCPKQTAELQELAITVHNAVFCARPMITNVVIRHYAATVCEQALAKGALPPSIREDSFRGPFESEWPQIMSASDEKTLEEESHRDLDDNDALRKVLESARTERMGAYGDWGRYQMGWAVSNFQMRRRSEEPMRDYLESAFDDRIAYRYVVQRVLEMGLDRASRDEPQAYLGGQRPSVERLGKKYQWIALYEFLGLLSDHYHPRPDLDGEIPNAITTADFHLPDMLDTVLFTTAFLEERNTWNFVRPADPWWARFRTAFFTPLDADRRAGFIMDSEIAEPSPLLVVAKGHPSGLPFVRIIAGRSRFHATGTNIIVQRLN